MARHLPACGGQTTLRLFTIGLNLVSLILSL